MAFSNEEFIFENKTWDEWVNANPNLVNMEFAIFASSVETKWNKYQIGWVELVSDDGL